MGRESVDLLPQELLQKASLRGNEYAWPLQDIPLVVQVAEKKGLVSIGGQLQFRIPDDGTCECYWVDVDTYRSVAKALPWPERVTRTAAVALEQFKNLRMEFDFVHEGRTAFGKYLAEAEMKGHSINEMMCFVWYLLSEQEAREKDL